MSVREALDFGDINMTVVQPVYLKPFPVWELDEYKGKEVIVVEQNGTGQLASLLREKACIDISARESPFILHGKPLRMLTYLACIP